MATVPMKVMKRLPDELVMTSCRRGNQSQVRIERVRQDHVQHESAVYIGDGPFMGVVIQDPSVGMAPVSAPDMHFSFVASLSGQGGPQPEKERREIMFWFKPKTGSTQKIQQVKEYFRELIAPENFPRDYVGFVKKNLILAKQYNMVRRIDLVVTPLPPEYEKDSGYMEDDGLPDDAPYRERLEEIRGRTDYPVQENIIDEHKVTPLRSEKDPAIFEEPDGPYNGLYSERPRSPTGRQREFRDGRGDRRYPYGRPDEDSSPRGYGGSGKPSTTTTTTLYVNPDGTPYGGPDGKPNATDRDDPHGRGTTTYYGDPTSTPTTTTTYYGEPDQTTKTTYYGDPGQSTTTITSYNGDPDSSTRYTEPGRYGSGEPGRPGSDYGDPNRDRDNRNYGDPGGTTINMYINGNNREPTTVHRYTNTTTEITTEILRDSPDRGKGSPRESPGRNGEEAGEGDLESTATESILDEDEEEGSRMIENYITVLTPSVYDYQYLPEVPVSNKTHITFRVRAWADAHIALSSVYGDTDRKTYEIVIGAFGNTRCLIRAGGQGPIMAEERTKNILNGQESLAFWISWSRDRLDVGRGSHRGSDRILRWRIPENKQHSVNCLAVSTGPGSKGEWEFVEYLAPETEEPDSKAAKRAQFQVSLLWLAKKQKMLNVLEDAYPCSVDTAELLRLSNIKMHDMMTVVVFLKDLQKRGLITELAKGVWMRAPGSLQDKTHEVRMVRDLPLFSGRDTPTIAVVTALFCEKLAVDAMMDRKISYVMYKSEGESNVYTVGRMADHQVVSTKLSRVGAGRAAATAAGNAVTRLLGTFNRIEHVLLVGVAGGVPHYNDYERHVRLGDIVVSMPYKKNKPVYLHCDQAEQTNNGKYDFTCRDWPQGTDTFPKIIDQLRSLNEHEGAWARPWEKYMDEGMEILDAEVSSFHRPPAKTDKLFAIVGDELLQVEHPKTPAYDANRELVPHIRFGPVGSGRFIARNEKLRMQLAIKHNLSAYSVELDAVLDAILGSKRESFLLIRGIADYTDGTKNKDWQPYASLAAAAYAKAVVAALPRVGRGFFR
jgi:nucleoside phosphorylase